MANKQMRSYCVFCLSFLDFKELLWMKGQEAGGRLLEEFAQLLMQVFGSNALLARYGEVKFAVGFNSNPRLLQGHLQRLDFFLQDKGIKYCTGTAWYPRDSRSGPRLFRLAKQQVELKEWRLYWQKSKQRQRLEKLATLGQLAAGLAHEIRNPLTSIRGFVQLAAAEFPQAAKWEQVILPELDRMNDLLSRFLNLSELKPMCFRAFELDKLIDDVANLLQPKAQLMGHTLDLHPPSQPVKLEADPEQLKQVLINLVQNGLEALEQPGAVSISWKAMLDFVYIVVRDTGCGISQEHLAKVFEPFFTTKSEGTGMGLAICQQIVAEHGGQIHITTQMRLGTAFHIHLPIRQDKGSARNLADAVQAAQQCAAVAKS